jgi:hypothetical protein
LIWENTNKYIKSGPFKVKKRELNHSLSTTTTKEKVKVFKTYDIDGILGGVLPEAVGKAISCRFQIHLDGKSSYSSIFLLTKNYNLFIRMVCIISTCDKNKFPFKIGDLNPFLVFPK